MFRITKYRCLCKKFGYQIFQQKNYGLQNLKLLKNFDEKKSSKLIKSSSKLIKE